MVELNGESMGERIYDLFSLRLQSGWLTSQPMEMEQIHRMASQKLAEFSQSQPKFILIDTPDSIEFITQFMAGLRLGIPIFLGNPDWGTIERSQFANLTSSIDPHYHQSQIMIPTGGSSGLVKFAVHTWETLSASAWGFGEFYQVKNINSVCILPLYHVSGLMQLVRSILTDGKLIITSFHQLCLDRSSFTNLDNYFISLVPTQLQKLLDLDPTWLTKFQTILLGGAPPSIELLTQARLAKLPLALTYGMTETASQITSLKPAQFLAGNNSCGQVLPHAEIKILTANDGEIGSISIKSRSLMLGYFPDFNSVNYFQSDDLGSIDHHGNLTIIGRNSSKIITGGKNVFPLEVVNAIMSTGLVQDSWVIGLPDRYWGQKVVAVYVPINSQIAAQQIIESIKGQISKYKLPKSWIKVAKIPRNSLGKILIKELTELAINLDTLL